VSLTVITGLSGAGAQECVRARLRAAAAAGRAALLLVPSSKHASHLRVRLAETCPVGLRVAAIDHFVESQWLLAGDGRRIVGGLHRDLVLSRALESAGVTEHPGRGTVTLLGTLATRSFAQGTGAEARVGGLSGRLVAALRGYRMALSKAGLVDAAEATRLLADYAPPAGVVGVEGLVSLTPDREALLRGWSAAGCEVVLSLPWRRGCAGTQPLDALVERLEATGACVEPCGPVADGRPEELTRMATGLFSGGPPVPGAGRVELGIARGDEAEARLIAARVSELLAAGTDGGQIAIAFADPGCHVGWLARALDDAGIDAAWDVRIPVSGTPLGRSMLRLWSFCAGGLAREDLAAFMRSPFSGVEADRCDHADVFWRARRVQGSELLGHAGRARLLVALCTRLAGRGIDAPTAKAWKELADRLLANAYGHDAPVPGMDGALDAAVHRVFCQALTAVAGDGGQPATAAELWAAFEASTVSPAAQDAPGRVAVTSFDGLRARTFEAVVIGGLVAGETPRQGIDDRLEGDAVRGALRAVGLTFDPEEHARGERLAFYLAVTAATRSLTLVRRETGDEGRALRASVFWEEFLDLYREPGAAAEQCRGLPPTHLRLQEDATEPSGRARRARGVLEDAAALAALERIDAVSPAEIERYVECPYRWFVERRLRPTTPDVEVDVMVAGQVAHRALASFYRTWMADGSRTRVTRERLVEARALARTAVEEAVAGAPAASTLDEQWLLASAEAAVVGLVGRDADFLPDYVPAEFEWSFGYGEGGEPIELGGVRIKGRADRIDTGPEGLIVIDYKRSRADSLAKIRQRGLVQLQLYALAASERLGLPVAGGLYRSLSASVDRGFVAKAVAGAFKPNDVVEPSAIDALLAQAVDAARVAYEGMKAGEIAPAPEKGRCRYCAALAFCPEGVQS
jgi:RecB family exonuclease